MRKLTILVLIFTFVSAANATVLSWSVDAITLGAPGWTAVLQLIGSDNVMYPTIVEVGYGPPAGPVSTVASISNIVARAAAGPDAVVMSPATYGFPGWWAIQTLDFLPPSDVSSGAQWDVTVSGLATGTHQFYSDHYGTNDMLQVTVLPEPTTVALLGLGGLLMLRRRK